MVSIALSLVVGARMACMYIKDYLQCLHYLFNGAIFTLLHQDGQPSAPDEGLPFIGDYWELAAHFCISLITCGVLVGESALPTVSACMLS